MSRHVVCHDYHDIPSLYVCVFMFMCCYVVLIALWNSYFEHDGTFVFICDLICKNLYIYGAY